MLLAARRLLRNLRSDLESLAAELRVGSHFWSSHGS